MNAPNALLLRLHSRGDTRRFGRLLAVCLQPGDLVVLEGDLGAGKTFLARAIARGLGVPSDVRITSPTFDLVHELPGRIPLLHLDLYRLDHPGSLVELGIGEPGAAGGAMLVEWGDRFASALGDDGLWLTLSPEDAVVRRCEVSARGAGGTRLLARLRETLEERDFHGRRCANAGA
jgi:tRNA threonylcarbamoyladenosine biosynthesis protein TsaE